jgi:hypothetical protein
MPKPRLRDKRLHSMYQSASIRSLRVLLDAAGVGLGALRARGVVADGLFGQARQHSTAMPGLRGYLCQPSRRCAAGVLNSHRTG